jgi:hypothetical protein
MMEVDYDVIKATAKANGLKVTDLLALSPGCDPFYVGSPGQMDKANWGASVYGGMGSPRECHIRRVHYWVVSQEPKLVKPDGSEYLNTVKDWEFLNLALKYARYAGFIPAENFIDRRNPAPIVNARFWDNEVPSETIAEIDPRNLIDTIVSKLECYNLHNTQPYLMEIFCEKSTMNDVLEPLCRRYGMNLVTGLGELSITAVRQLVEERAYMAQKPVRIFYISDFDPAGECMPVSVARKIEYFVRKANDEGYDIKLKPIVLTRDQCEHYQLPRTPIKETERRKAGFEDRHGTGATELDALESLHPGELAEIIVNEIQEFFNVAAWNTVIQENQRLQDEVKGVLEDKIDTIQQFIQDTLSTIDMEDFDIFKAPIGDLKDESEDEWLYDSDRDYLGQMYEYKRHKQG